MNTELEQRRARSRKHLKILLVSVFTLLSCAETAHTLGEEELLKLLVEAKRRGPYQFQLQVWPALEKKTIRYCGPIEESTVVGTSSVVILKVNKPYGGETLPWLLEGKSETPSVAQMHTAGEAVCMTGVIESFMERDNVYWGYVKIVSLEKPVTS